MRCSLRMKPIEVEKLAAIDRLCESPAAGSALNGEFEGLRRLRVGRDRVVDEWQQHDLVVLVVRIGHRREVYR